MPTPTASLQDVRSRLVKITGEDRRRILKWFKDGFHARAINEIERLVPEPVDVSGMAIR